MKSKLSKNISVNIPVEIPIIPNFIKVGNDYFSIKDFTVKELEDIGREWTKQLIKKSQLTQ